MFAFHGCRRRLYQLLIEEVLHSQADVVGKLSNVEPLHVAQTLNGDDDQSIHQAEGVHVRGLFGAAEHVVEVLGQLAVKPGAGNHADVVEEAAEGDDQE